MSRQHRDPTSAPSGNHRDDLIFVDGKLQNITDKGELFSAQILALAGKYEDSGRPRGEPQRQLVFV